MTTQASMHAPLGGRPPYALACWAAHPAPIAPPLCQVDTVEHVRWVYDWAKLTLGSRLQGQAPPALIVMCESGMSLLNLRCTRACSTCPELRLLALLRRRRQRRCLHVCQQELAASI